MLVLADNPEMFSFDLITFIWYGKLLCWNKNEPKIISYSYGKTCSYVATRNHACKYFSR